MMAAIIEARNLVKRFDGADLSIALFCSSVGATSNAARHVPSPSHVSRLSTIAVTTLVITLVLYRHSCVHSKISSQTKLYNR